MENSKFSLSAHKGIFSLIKIFTEFHVGVMKLSYNSHCLFRIFLSLQLIDQLHVRVQPFMQFIVPFTIHGTAFNELIILLLQFFGKSHIIGLFLLRINLKKVYSFQNEWLHLFIHCPFLPIVQFQLSFSMVMLMLRMAFCIMIVCMFRILMAAPK